MLCRRLLVLEVVLLALVACAAAPEPSAPLAAETGAPATTTTEPPVAAAASGAAPSTTATAPPSRPVTRTAPDIAAPFRPLDDRCTTDADCAATQLGVGERFACCDPCGSVAGTRAWVAKANQLCHARHVSGRIDRCPPRDCGPSTAKCSAGQCVTVP